MYLVRFHIFTFADLPENTVWYDAKYLEYEKEMQRLKEQYENEYLSKCQVQADLQYLKARYDEDVLKLNNLVSICFSYLLSVMPDI